MTFIHQSNFKLHIPLYLLAILVVSGCQMPDVPHDPNALYIGDTPISVTEHFSNGQSNITFVNVHEDEQTSIKAMRNMSLDRGINYIYLKHEGTRRITFSLKNQTYNFDPNRMFTETGRKLTLTDGELYSDKAEEELQLFSENFLHKLDSTEVIIALHNNTPDEYSILSYLPGGSESENTEEVYVNQSMDSDDFIYTTDKDIYNEMVDLKINVILQNNTHNIDDGSLSIYCGQHNIRYINIETEHGHLHAQLNFMEVLLGILEY